MRGVYVCRALSEDRLTGSGAEIYSLACAAARGGHDVYLVSETLAGYRTVPRGPVHLTEPLDRIEFVAAEGFTAIRAKRLLGEFAGVRLVVSAVGPGISPAPGLRAAVTAHAEGYCRRYADEVVTERPVVTAGGELLPAGPAASGPPTEVWFIGASPVE